MLRLMIGIGTEPPIITDVMFRAGKVFGKWELRTEGRYIDEIAGKVPYLPSPPRVHLFPGSFVCSRRSQPTVSPLSTAKAKGP